MIGPSVRSRLRLSATTSSAREVSGSGAANTFTSSACSAFITGAQLDPSAHAPWALLLPIGEALAKFVCEEDFADVKACEGHSCTLVFADHTRRRARRWCTRRSAVIAPNRPRTA